MSASSRFFSFSANVMYVERILAPWAKVIPRQSEQTAATDCFLCLQFLSALLLVRNSDFSTGILTDTGPFV